jgi:hypothetical protein
MTWAESAFFIVAIVCCTAITITLLIINREPK